MPHRPPFQVVVKHRRNRPIDAQSARDDKGAHRKQRHRHLYPYIEVFSAHMHSLAARNGVLAAAPRSILRR